MKVSEIDDPNGKKSRAEYMPLIPALKTWLGVEGISFFKKIVLEYGKVNAVWNEGGIPHAVHFREGMQVRNQLRDLTNNSWTCYEYDNTWEQIIEECIS
jgi:hypothetical protein